MAMQPGQESRRGILRAGAAFPDTAAEGFVAALGAATAAGEAAASPDRRTMTVTTPLMTRWPVEILHNQRNTTIRRIEGVLWQAKTLVRVAAHLGNLVVAKPLFLHQTARRVGAIGGKLPVAVIRVIGVGQRIRVSLDGDAVGHSFSCWASIVSSSRPFAFRCRAARYRKTCRSSIPAARCAGPRE